MGKQRYDIKDEDQIIVSAQITEGGQKHDSSLKEQKSLLESQNQDKSDQVDDPQFKNPINSLSITGIDQSIAVDLNESIFLISPIDYLPPNYQPSVPHPHAPLSAKELKEALAAKESEETDAETKAAQSVASVVYEKIIIDVFPGPVPLPFPTPKEYIKMVKGTIKAMNLDGSMVIFEDELAEKAKKLNMEAAELKKQEEEKIRLEKAKKQAEEEQKIMIEKTKKEKEKQKEQETGTVQHLLTQAYRSLIRQEAQSHRNSVNSFINSPQTSKSIFDKVNTNKKAIEISPFLKDVPTLGVGLVYEHLVQTGVIETKNPNNEQKEQETQLITENQSPQLSSPSESKYERDQNQIVTNNQFETDNKLTARTQNNEIQEQPSALNLSPTQMNSILPITEQTSNTEKIQQIEPSTSLNSPQLSNHYSRKAQVEPTTEQEIEKMYKDVDARIQDKTAPDDGLFVPPPIVSEEIRQKNIAQMAADEEIRQKNIKHKRADQLEVQPKQYAIEPDLRGLYPRALPSISASVLQRQNTNNFQHPLSPLLRRRGQLINQPKYLSQRVTQKNQSQSPSFNDEEDQELNRQQGIIAPPSAEAMEASIVDAVDRGRLDRQGLIMALGVVEALLAMIQMKNKTWKWRINYLKNVQNTKHNERMKKLVHWRMREERKAYFDALKAEHEKLRQLSQKKRDIAKQQQTEQQQQQKLLNENPNQTYNNIDQQEKQQSTSFHLPIVTYPDSSQTVQKQVEQVSKVISEVQATIPNSTIYTSREGDISWSFLSEILGAASSKIIPDELVEENYSLQFDEMERSTMNSGSQDRNSNSSYFTTRHNPNYSSGFSNSPLISLQSIGRDKRREGSQWKGGWTEGVSKKEWTEMALILAYEIDHKKNRNNDDQTSQTVAPKLIDKELEQILDAYGEDSQDEFELSEDSSEGIDDYDFTQRQSMNQIQTPQISKNKLSINIPTYSQQNEYNKYEEEQKRSMKSERKLYERRLERALVKRASVKFHQPATVIVLGESSREAFKRQKEEEQKKKKLEEEERLAELDKIKQIQIEKERLEQEQLKEQEKEEQRLKDEKMNMELLQQLISGQLVKNKEKALEQNQNGNVDVQDVKSKLIQDSQQLDTLHSLSTISR
ncbi:MAG: hypothetical protein EZS28_024629, partial [Streblomastix strix]